jgi:hypothetical protein
MYTNRTTKPAKIILRRGEGTVEDEGRDESNQGVL